MDTSFDYKKLAHGNIPADYDVKWFESIRNGEASKQFELGKVNAYCIGDDRWIYKDYPTAPSHMERLRFSDFKSRCAD